jgi:hypothetical protein
MPDVVDEVETETSQLLIHELLDRYEILYPDITELADLRRAVIDRDLSSIFRLCDQTDDNEEIRKAVVDENLHSIFRLMEYYTVQGHSDDLRRAILENNLYSLFRLFPEDNEVVNIYRTAIVNKNLRSIFKLIGNDDLRKLITEENTWKLWPIIEKYVSTQFTNAFKNFFINDITIDKDCFSRGQLLSKMWLVDELEKLDLDLGTVFLCAGWYATLATMIFESNIKVDKVRSFDIDSSCVKIAKVFNKPWVMKDWKFQATTEDIQNIEYPHTYHVLRNNNTKCELSDMPDTIINTSCEHIENFTDWYSKIPDGKLVVLQSNNYFEIKEHVNCVNDIYEFKEMAPMSELHYMGMRELPKYTRFMLIGYK